MRRNIAIILAAGAGSRMQSATPKQLMLVRGRTVLEHTIEAFSRNAMIDEIALVVSAAIAARVEAVVARGQWPKVRKVLLGGRRRCDSSMQAVRAYAGEDCNLLLHDAARMLVSQDIITNVCNAMRQHRAAAVAVPATDTIFSVSQGCVSAIPNRASLMCAQTPQAFRCDVIELAYRRAAADPSFLATDDCGAVVRYVPEVKVRIVGGDERNIKITYPDDIARAEQYLESQTSEP